MSFMLVVNGTAAETSGVEDSIPSEINEVIEKQQGNTDAVKNGDIGEIGNTILTSFKENSAEPLTLLAKILFILVLASLARAFTSGESELQAMPQIDAVVAVTTFVLVAKPLLSLLVNLEEAIFNCRNFIISFVPAFSAMLIGSGQPASGAVFGGFFLTGAVVIAEVICTFLLPLIKIFIAMNVAGGISNELNLTGLCNMILKIIKKALVIFVTIFSALLGLQSIYAGAADNLAQKAGKMVVGSGVPIIGRAVSDAMSTVYASLGIIKSTAGIAGICAVIALLLPILLQCISYYLVLYFAGAAAKLTDNQRCAATMEGFCGCVELYAAIISFFAVIIIIATSVMMSAGG